MSRYEQGTEEALQLAASPSDQSNAIIQGSARLALKVLRTVSQVVHTVYPHFGVSKPSSPWAH